MVFSNMLYILQHFNFITFFIVNNVSVTVVQYLRLDYCENFKLARKETIDKLKWNSYVFVFLKILSIFY